MRFLSAVLALVAMLSSPALGADGTPLSIPSATVHEVPSTENGRRYAVWVDVPPAYAESDRRFPVVFVLDPNFTFMVTRTVRDFSGQRGRNIEPFILVGLVHDRDVSAMTSRSRDYTSTDPRIRNPEEYTQAAYGEAESYRRYVERDVFPLIASQYRADMTRTALIGHSYGALFGLHVLFTSPEMFDAYILGSPSLWFDQHAVLNAEEAFAARTRTLPVRIHMVAGSYETQGPTDRHYKRNDLAGDMTRFAERLRSRGYAGLTVTTEVAEGEDHFTVFHDVASRGLLRMFPGTGPYTSG